MNKEILSVVEAVSNEKSLPREKIFKVLESALEKATKKKYEQDIDIRIYINRKNGNLLTFRRWLVVKEVLQPTKEITLDAAKLENINIKINDYIEDNIDSVIFDRVITQKAKKIIVKKVREAEKEIIIKQFKKKIGLIVIGNIKKIQRNNIFVNLGNNAEAIMHKKGMLPKENFRLGERIRGILFIINPKSKKAQLLISRIGTDMLIALFNIEIPEILDKIIEIKKIARDPGSRSKIAVKTNDEKVDPVGACVGIKGSRVQSISNELNGERIDIILWDKNPSQFVINAMAPADVNSITIDHERNSMDILVNFNNLSQSIGRNGQNVKLASQLTGWELNVITLEDIKIKKTKKTNIIFKNFKKYLDFNDLILQELVDFGFSSFEDLSMISKNVFLNSNIINTKIINEIKKQSKKVLKLISLDFKISYKKNKINKELLNLDNMNINIAIQLIKKNIFSLEDLADQGTDDLIDIEGLNIYEIKKLIMDARNICWFDKNINKYKEE
ncbi:transcription termination factor NusA [Buchnera aphidicola]|uniref:transcription termination factor NusA n=1 Tax=Buchnera aphidicola TaxID=9 RepID=UPI0031B89CE2